MRTEATAYGAEQIPLHVRKLSFGITIHPADTLHKRFFPCLYETLGNYPPAHCDNGCRLCQPRIRALRANGITIGIYDKEPQIKTDSGKTIITSKQ